MWYQMQKGAEISRMEFTKKMWSTINAEAEWLQDLKNELGDLEKVREVKISAPMTKKQQRKMPNWKSVGHLVCRATGWKSLERYMRELQLD